MKKMKKKAAAKIKQIPRTKRKFTFQAKADKKKTEKTGKRSTNVKDSCQTIEQIEEHVPRLPNFY